MSNTKCFADLIKVCSVLPALMVMPAMAEVERTVVGAGENKSFINQTWADFGQSDVWSGGAIYLTKGGQLTIAGGRYSNLSADQVYDKATGKWHGVGGALAEGYTAGTKLFVKDYNGARVQFLNNKAYAAGGAMWLGRESDIRNADFIGNSVYGTVTDNTNSDTSVDGGGALFFGSDSTAKMTDVLLKNNSSTSDGGAIAMRAPTMGNNKNAKLDIYDTDFVGNTAVMKGGAIYATFYDSVTERNAVYMQGSDFVRNTAESGGAIYNDGILDKGDNKANMKIVDADFEYNSATVEGGAIFNKGTMTIIDSEFVGNSVVDGFGGAIKNNGTITVNDTDFYNNVAYSNGAFSTSRSTGDTTIAGGEFVGNHALADGGALGLYLDATVSDVDFKNNVAAKAIILDGKAYDAAADANGGGALFVGQKAKATLTNVHFLENESGVSGGAIVARHNTSVDNGYLTIKSSEFVGNKAGKHGGAIESIYDGVVNIADTTFESNSAKLSGGVIYNGVDINYGNDTGVGLDSTNHGVFNLSGNNTFANNVAGVKGGAIFNDEGGKFTLDGNNTFTGNTANGVANDIHNLGTVTIASGMTSIDGGITGDGILNIEEGATLNMNYASIEQGTINIDGTLMASLLNDKDSVDVTGALSGAGNVLLSAGAAGVYDVSQFTDAKLSVDFGKTYQTSIVDGVATLTARQAAEIATDTGASIAAAGAVSGLAASTDARLQKVSLAMQEALNNESVAAVEQEVAKVNPNKKPVGQSVSSSVQNQVLSLASGRMSTVGGMTGRAGGDVTGAGVWAQGIVNKSKMGSQFEGRSRGFAMGGDTLIDNVFTLGGGYAYSDTDVLGGGRDIDVESNSIFVYGQYKPAAWYVNATLTYTESEYTDMANIMGEFLDQNYDIKAYGAQAMFGYDFASGVTPEVGLRYLHTTQGEHENSFGATVKDLDVNFLSGVAGLKYEFAIESDTAVKFSPSMRAAMTYDFLSEDAQATVVFPGAAAYYVDVDSLSRMGGEFGLGLTAEYRGLELSLNYELTLHKDYTSQTGLFKFRYNF